LLPVKEKLDNRMNSRRKLGIFGGSFDPVHMGHISTLLRIKKLYNFDEIIFVPTFIVNSKKKIIATPDQRIKMLEISLSKHDLNLDLREIRRKGTSFTVDTLKSLQEDYPDTDLVLILGSDSFFTLPEWRESEQILGLCNIIVVKRDGHSYSDLINNSPKFLSQKITKDVTIFDGGRYGNILFEDRMEIKISSSRVREILKNNQLIDGLIDEDLQDWLSQNKIY
tara:strand:- start:1656 stop:2327 length:672 start_codon:yes stop_codon:yes gene_type:complete